MVSRAVAVGGTSSAQVLRVRQVIEESARGAAVDSEGRSSGRDWRVGATPGRPGEWRAATSDQQHKRCDFVLAVGTVRTAASAVQLLGVGASRWCVSMLLMSLAVRRLSRWGKTGTGRNPVRTQGSRKLGCVCLYPKGPRVLVCEQQITGTRIGTGGPRSITWNPGSKAVRGHFQQPSVRDACCYQGTYYLYVGTNLRTSSNT